MWLRKTQPGQHAGLVAERRERGHDLTFRLGDRAPLNHFENDNNYYLQMQLVF